MLETFMLKFEGLFLKFSFPYISLYDIYYPVISNNDVSLANYRLLSFKIFQFWLLNINFALFFLELTFINISIGFVWTLGGFRQLFSSCYYYIWCIKIYTFGVNNKVYKSNIHSWKELFHHIYKMQKKTFDICIFKELAIFHDLFWYCGIITLSF